MKNNDSQNQTTYMPIFMCLGISIGMAIGAPFDSIPIGMCIGVGAGTCIGGIIDHLNRKKSNDDQNNENNENE